MGNLDTQDSPRPELEGSHHLPPYSILYTSPWGPHPNGFLSRDSQMGLPKFSQLGLPLLWRRITSCVDLWSRWSLKQSCTPLQKLSNGMLHVAWTQGNQVYSRLLMVRSQTTNLTLNLFFGYNLCFRCLNGQCEPIFYIYASISFQWYKHLFQEMSFDPCNCALKIWESIWDSNSQHGSLLGCEGSCPHTFCTLENLWCDSRVSLLACNLATLCLSRKPKARVATMVGMSAFILKVKG
jgi:hypothetical protein